MPINSRAKGAVGEREWAKFLSDAGFPARRGQQFNGLEGKDVVCDSLQIHWEVKRTERFQLYKALDQATKDAALTEMPVVAHRMSRKRWVVVLDANDFMELCRDSNLVKVKFESGENISLEFPEEKK